MVKMTLTDLIEEARKHGFFLLHCSQKRNYTQDEVDTIVDMATNMEPLIRICCEVQRTPNSVMKKLRELGVVKFVGDHYVMACTGAEWIHFSDFQKSKDDFDRMYPREL